MTNTVGLPPTQRERVSGRGHGHLLVLSIFFVFDQPQLAAVRTNPGHFPLSSPSKDKVPPDPQASLLPQRCAASALSQCSLLYSAWPQ